MLEGLDTNIKYLSKEKDIQYKKMKQALLVMEDLDDENKIAFNSEQKNREERKSELK